MSSDEDANKVIKMIKKLSPFAVFLLIGGILGWVCRGLLG